MSQEEVDAVASEEVAEESAEQEEVSEEVSEEVDSEESSEESGDGEELSDEQAEELADEVKEAIAEGASKEEVQELVEKFKIKVNGQEKEVELDWNNKEDIVRRLQLAEAAQEAMQAKAETEKAFEREINKLKDNPWDVIEQLGLDPDELAEARIQRQIEELQKTPEQKAQEAKDQELEELRAQLKKEQEAKEQAEADRLQQKYVQDLQSEIEDALKATTQLPNTKLVRDRVINTMAHAMENGHPDIKAKDVVPIVEKEFNNELNEFLETMPDQVLEKFMSKKVTERLRKQRLAKIPTKKKVVDTKKSIEPAERKKISLHDFARKGFGNK